jgi:hypothetical protein
MVLHKHLPVISGLNENIPKIYSSGGQEQFTRTICLRSFSASQGDKAMSHDDSRPYCAADSHVVSSG